MKIKIIMRDMVAWCPQYTWLLDANINYGMVFNFYFPVLDEAGKARASYYLVEGIRYNWCWAMASLSGLYYNGEFFIMLSFISVRRPYSIVHYITPY